MPYESLFAREPAQQAWLWNRDIMGDFTFIGTAAQRCAVHVDREMAAMPGQPGIFHPTGKWVVEAHYCDGRLERLSGPQPVPPGKLVFGRLKDAKLAGEIIAKASAFTQFPHVEDPLLRGFLADMGELPSKLGFWHADGTGSCGLETALLKTAKSALADHDNPEVPEEVSAARLALVNEASHWALRDNETNRIVAHALLRMCWGA